MSRRFGYLGLVAAAVVAATAAGGILLAKAASTESTAAGAAAEQGNPLRDARTSAAPRPDPGPMPPPGQAPLAPVPPAHPAVVPAAGPRAGAEGATKVELREGAGSASAPQIPGGKKSPPPAGRRLTPADLKKPPEKYEPLFVGWPRPRAVLLISGRQDGYLEPCGCAGLSRMKGGMARRHALFRLLREGTKPPLPVVGLDVGGIGKGYGQQAELKFQTAFEGMRKWMRYDAVALGRNELRLPCIVAAMPDADGQKTPFVSANVAVLGFAAGLTPEKKIIAAGPFKLGVTAVLGKTYIREINNSDLEMIDPELGLQRVLPALEKEGCDLKILLAHATKEETLQLAGKFKGFDIVVTSDGYAAPSNRMVTIKGTDTVLVDVGEKGEYVVALGLYDKPPGGDRPAIRYQSVPLDGRESLKGTEEMKALMSIYQTQLKDLGFERLGLKPIPHPRAALLGEYVGSKACADCHPKSYSVWKKSKHAHALETLENQVQGVPVDPPRNHDPECIACHVTGWFPQQFTLYDGGYTSRKATPRLSYVGCEDCHGPGGAHCEAEQGNDKALQLKLQKAAVVTKEDCAKPGGVCGVCHDLDNSPDFNFKVYWPEVQHYEDEDAEPGSKKATNDEGRPLKQ